ncbi:MAG: hypothetical protein LBM69_10660, partial [Lachnospiraceae bacterium]|nr:hypothetical protein [Lachnospiraceae bacterium]
MKKAKINTKMQLTKRRVFLTIIIPVLLLVIGGIGILFLLRQSESTPPQSAFGDNDFSSFTGFGATDMAADMVTASGVVGVGITQELFGIQDLDTPLIIEEVMVSADTEVKAFDSILKVSEESFAAAKQELIDNLEEAKLASQSGAIAYAQSLITLKYDLDTALLKGEQAQAVYEAAVADVHKQEEEAQEALDQAKEDIATRQAALDGDTYYEDYQVGTYKAIYDENMANIQEKPDDWGVTWTQITGGAGGGNGDPAGYVMTLRAMY